MTDPIQDAVRTDGQLTPKYFDAVLTNSRPPNPVFRAWAATPIQSRERPGNHQCDVILLFATAAELLDRPYD